MAEADIGTRDARGEWRPAELIKTPPVFVWPPQPVGFLKWLFGYPGYLLPWNVMYMAIAVFTWFVLTPPLADMANFEPWWIALIFVRNLGLLVLLAGAWHLYFYMLKGQGRQYKYSGRWMATNNRTFLFRDQVRDNVFWNVVSGCTIWSAYEVVTMYAYANGWLPYIDFDGNPVWFVVLLCLVQLMREVHFYWVHRLLHWPPLYKAAHYLHHKNVNIGPWSGLSMHPIEHILYFSGVLFHWIIPSHPIHAIFHLQHAGLTPAQGHLGFDEVVIGKLAVPNRNYIHYLHHRYFECNYGGDGSVPFDRWFGTLHDGSPEAHAAMRERMRKIHAKEAEAAEAT